MLRRSISLPLYWKWNVVKKDAIISILEIECGEEGCHYLYIRSGMRRKAYHYLLVGNRMW